MSVEASRRELTQLIYTHLNEHGFHSAAEELQKYSPQVETQVTESLLDIYRSWLRLCRQKGKSESKSGEKVIKAKKSKTQTKAQAVAGDDSDSDDSLDVDKWKKLLQQMTDSDMAKMDTINALDSAASPPVQKKNTVGENKTMEEKAITETPTKKSKPKKSTSKKKAPVICSAAPSQRKHIRCRRQSSDAHSYLVKTG
ncbi:hypothetical protein F7725_010035 [Dissostichus mawsoni]|uniref:LisH domain-containing protein n=1 Tax=Dissostichus mawsoni TaxID=36200 RepID=A0A7J5XNW0_DISMA|nr:hypothetical protein F7725_010035 [Dissostichus mawsoni]